MPTQINYKTYGDNIDLRTFVEKLSEDENFNTKDEIETANILSLAARREQRKDKK